MTTTPTPEAFMTLAQPEDNFEPDTVPSVDPLESIAESLRVVASSLTGQHDEALQTAREEYDDLEAKHRALFGLLAEIEKLVAPSTSKLANGVREAIARWRNPVVESVPEPVEPVPVENAAEMGHPAPAHDADVEEWRAYARSLGYIGTDINAANRSQIRTMLGIEQPAS